MNESTPFVWIRPKDEPPPSVTQGEQTERPRLIAGAPVWNRCGVPGIVVDSFPARERDAGMSGMVLVKWHGWVGDYPGNQRWTRAEYLLTTEPELDYDPFTDD